MNLEICQFQSTVLARAGYNADREILVLWFKCSPHVGYEYSGVPLKIWDGLLHAHSKGKYYRYNILGTYSANQHRIHVERRSDSSMSNLQHSSRSEEQVPVWATA